MSSPLSSLKHGKKTPLLPGRRPAPFKPQDYSVEAVIDEQLKLQRSEYNTRPVQRPHRSLPKENGSAPNDKELLSTMMHRLAKAEQSLMLAQETNREKDKRIKVLEEKCKIIDKARGHGNEQVLELEKKCKKLLKRMHSMEKFLEDYGMVWVGDEEESDDERIASRQSNYEELEPRPSVLQSNETRLWNPGSSLANPSPMQVNFDLIVKNIEELNALAGEGEHVISHTTRGARLKVRESVPLTLYANGIFMFNGPFRPFSDPETQTYIQDIMDGYFPSELQSRYPNGVPFLLNDLRDTYFRDERQERFFTGTGKTLLEQTSDTSSDKNVQTTEQPIIKETSQPPGRPKQTVEQFLNKLPSSVIKDGKVVDIKSGLKEALKGPEARGSETVVIENDADIATGSNETGQSGEVPNDITTLRIKSEKGDKNYCIKMKYLNTIGDLRRQINRIRQQKSTNYQLKTSFPNKIYDDDNATLQDCGLVPNATLHILIKR